MTSFTPDHDLDPVIFTATVTSLAHSFGDNTRRKIYLFLREHPGATATELSRHCHVHPNVVRHHLDKLTESGFVTFDNVHRTTVGRPAKGYRVCEENANMSEAIRNVAWPLRTNPEAENALRRDALLVSLLEMALERLGPEAAEGLAHDVGWQFGKDLSSMTPEIETQITIRSALTSVAGLLTAHGFAARFEDHESGQSVVSDSCPFGAAAQTHPVLCAVDRGLVSGMLAGMGVASTKVTLTSRARGDVDCRVTA